MPARASWWPFLAGSFAFFTVMSGATIPTPLYPIYSDRYGFSSFTVTLIFAVYSAGVMVSLLGTGPWSDQIGRKPMLLAGLVAAVGAAVAFLLADGLPLLVIARLLQGLSVGIYASAATVAVSELAPPGADRVGSLGATAANVGGLGAGSIIGGVVATIAPAPLVTPYLVHLATAAIAIAALLATPEPGERAENPRLRAQGLAVPGEVRDIFVPAGLAAFAIFMICGFLGAVAPSYFGDILGQKGNHILIGTAAGAIFLTSVAGQAAVERLPEGRVLPIGMGIMSAGIAAITAAIAVQSLWGLVAAIAFAGVGHGISFRGGLTAMSARAPEGQVAMVTATYFTVVYVAISIPVLVIGALQGPLGLQPVTLGYAAFSVALSLAAFVLILRRG